MAARQPVTRLAIAHFGVAVPGLQTRPEPAQQSAKKGKRNEDGGVPHCAWHRKALQLYRSVNKEPS